MLTCARGCSWPKLHKTDCADEASCRGCLPIPAEVGAWCARCASKARGWLSDLPDLAAEVATLPGGRLNLAPPAASDAPRAPSKDPASASPAYDTGEEVARWLFSWTELVCDRTGMAGPARYSVSAIPVLQPHACARFLREWLSAVSEVEPVQFYDELRQLHGGLVRSLGLDVPVERMTQPCPRCDLLTVSREDGGDVVCENPDCSSVWRLDEWDRLMGVAS